MKVTEFGINTEHFAFKQPNVLVIFGSGLYCVFFFF